MIVVVVGNEPTVEVEIILESQSYYSMSHNLKATFFLKKRKQPKSLNDRVVWFIKHLFHIREMGNFLNGFQ